MYALFVKVNLKPEHVDSYLEAVVALDAKGSVGNEPGCLRFDVLRDESNPAQVYLYEVYADKAAFEAHGKMPHMAKFREAVQGMSAGPAELVRALSVFPNDADWKKQGFSE